MNRFLLLMWLAACMPVVAADEYSEAREHVVAAYQAKDYPAMRDAALRAVAIRPELPGATFNLALAHALANEPEKSLAELNRLLEREIAQDVREAEAFAGLKTLPGWNGYIERLENLLAAKGEARVAYRLQQADFIPEGFAIVEDALFIGSIRHGILASHAKDGTTTVSDPARGGHWSVFGMRAANDGTIWFASAAVAQLQGVTDAEQGRSGLFQFDPEKNAIVRSLILPDDGREHVLGDLVIAGNGDIYASDSMTGDIYRYDDSAQRLDALSLDVELRSPQGMVFSADERYLYIADYTRGLYRLELASGKTKAMATPDDVSLYGIDGLYRHRDSLIAIQNGITPHRVLRISLAEDGSSVSGAETLLRNHPEFDEPTLGLVRNGKFLLVANSHWNRFGRDGELVEPASLSGPVILELSLE